MNFLKSGVIFKLRILKTIIVSLFLLFSSFNIVVNSESNKNDYVKIIKNVPYNGQNESFYCNWACFTMVLRYYGINATLNEVLFNQGVGYSLSYFGSEYFRLPRSGHHISVDPYNYLFLSEIYGLSYTPFKYNYSSIEKWSVNWPKIKENVTKNIPVIVFVNELVLLSDYMKKKGTYPLKKFITKPANIGIHFVLVVGYNETDNTICYNDPSYQIIDKPEIGTYRWTNIETFKLAHDTLPEWYDSQYYFQVLEKVKEPMTKEQAFIFAHNRNIEKLKGNRSAYFSYIRNINWTFHSKYGINASQLLKTYYEGLEVNTTIKSYKLQSLLKGFIYDLFNPLYKFYSFFNFKEKTILDMIEARMINFFDHIAYDKKYTAEYLSDGQYILNDKNLSNICKYEASLFCGEAENWTKLSKSYNEFLRKGFLISNYKAVNIINNMDKIMESIIELEDKIISSSLI